MRRPLSHTGKYHGIENRDRLRRVTEAACLDAFVADLPDGFDTRVGEPGTRLSGDQQQRIGIAHRRSILAGCDRIIQVEQGKAGDAPR